MEIEQLEIRDYLSTVPPLDMLDGSVLDNLSASLEITYARKETVILDCGLMSESVYLIRSGAVEITNDKGKLLGRISEGQWFGYRSVLDDEQVGTTVSALEDCLLYLIPADVFVDLAKDNDVVRRYFTHLRPERIQAAITHIRDPESSAMIAVEVGDLTHGSPLFIEKTATIQHAAQLMTEKTVTAMLVTDNGKLSGILTDRAFCTKVAAQGLNLNDPVGSIMTPNPMTIAANEQGANALLKMARHNIRHLPVISAGEVVGMITATDLIRRQSHNAIYLINEIYRAKSIEELQTLSKQLPNTLHSLVENSLTADDIAHTISSIGEAITLRLLKMAEAKLGEPPVPYAWISAGSMARDEQTAHSDQDNAIILSDDFKAGEHDAYFLKLATFVSDGLNACGYVYCPGDVMATNPKWRQPLAVWQGYFETWINQPEPRALMYASIFFDLESLYGEHSLLATLRAEILQKTLNNTIFLAFMAGNALQYQPPLGFFRNLVLEKGGEHGNTLNMKKRGVTPIIDLARVYALEAGLEQINTRDRLEAACEAGVLSRSGMMDLKDAYEFIGTVRLQHQARQVAEGKEPDNYVSPEQMSSLERRHLKDAFAVVSTLQAAMEQRYRM
jgi:CBS domain-containing protein